jgi:hypothetical protein
VQADENRRSSYAPYYHCGGVYGTTAGGAAPYATGAVAQGSHAGAGGQGGGHGAGLGMHQLQQPQPAQLTVTSRTAERSDFLFIFASPYRELPLPVLRLTKCAGSLLPLRAPAQILANQPYPAKNDVQTQWLSFCNTFESFAAVCNGCNNSAL